MIKHILLAGAILAQSSAVSFSVNKRDCSESYKVKKGDTLSEISLKFFGRPIWNLENGSLLRVTSCNKIKNVNLIYPGEVIYFPKYRKEIESINKEIITVGTMHTAEKRVESQSYIKKNKPAVDLGDRHRFQVTLASHHQELAGKQTRGNGIGSRANEIISAVRLSAYFDYFYKASKQFHVWSQLGLLWSEYRPNLTNKIVDNDNDYIPTATLGGLFEVNNWLDIRLGVRYLPQLYLFGDESSGNLFFETENTTWAVLGGDFNLLNKEKWSLSLSPEFHYAVVEGDLISGNKGYSLKLALGFGSSKSWGLFSRYYKGQYRFFSSDITFERLELGASKRF